MLKLNTFLIGLFILGTGKQETLKRNLVNSKK